MSRILRRSTTTHVGSELCVTINQDPKIPPRLHKGPLAPEVTGTRTSTSPIRVLCHVLLHSKVACVTVFDTLQLITVSHSGTFSEFLILARWLTIFLSLFLFSNQLQVCLFASTSTESLIAGRQQSTLPCHSHLVNDIIFNAFDFGLKASNCVRSASVSYRTGWKQ